MTISVDATYEGGVLKPAEPLPFAEHEVVQITIRSATAPGAAAPDDAEAVVRRSYGLLGWTGDTETLRRLAEGPEFDPQESG